MLPAAPAERLDHRVGQRIGIRLAHLVGRHNVVDRCKRAVGHQYRESEVAQHAERLRTRHLVDQVGADEQLGLAVGQRSYCVRFPDFLEE